MSTKTEIITGCAIVIILAVFGLNAAPPTTNAPMTPEAVLARIESDKERYFKTGAAVAIALYDENPTRFESRARLIETAWAEFNRIMALNGEEFRKAATNIGKLKP